MSFILSRTTTTNLAWSIAPITKKRLTNTTFDFREPLADQSITKFDILLCRFQFNILLIDPILTAYIPIPPKYPQFLNFYKVYRPTCFPINFQTCCLLKFNLISDKDWDWLKTVLKKKSIKKMCTKFMMLDVYNIFVCDLWFICILLNELCPKVKSKKIG